MLRACGPVSPRTNRGLRQGPEELLPQGDAGELRTRCWVRSLASSLSPAKTLVFSSALSMFPLEVAVGRGTEAQIMPPPLTSD